MVAVITVAGKIGGAQGSRPAKALGDHPVKRLSKAASEPAESGRDFAVPSLDLIIIIIAIDLLK